MQVYVVFRVNFIWSMSKSGVFVYFDGSAKIKPVKCPVCCNNTIVIASYSRL